MPSLKKLLTNPIYSPFSLFLTSTLAAVLYVLMEWLFIATKPEFLATVTFGEKVLILLNSAAVLALLCALVCLVYLALFTVLKSQSARIVLGVVFALVPALILTTLALLMVDNFTYNLFKVGVVTSHGFIRGLYAGAFVLTTLLLLKRVIAFTNRVDQGSRGAAPKTHHVILITFSVILLVCAALPIAFNPALKSAFNRFGSNAELTSKPNIILITADSVNASKMSAYGFDKDTTPFLKGMRNSSLVAENNFSNAQGTIGSITSILTGRYPVDIRVLASADILRGEDAFLHLPGILRKKGYHTVQLSYSYYADANNLNLQSGFDETNGESMASSPITSTAARLLPADYYYFLHTLATRATDRLLHIFFIRDMANPYKQMTESPEKFNDPFKLNTAISLLDSSDQPLFVHLHWLNTHGPKYYPERQVFSAGIETYKQGSRDEPFYLDSILEFDTAMGRLYSELEKRGMLENTILIIASDHSQRWSISRLPLIIRFPHAAHNGQVTANTQNLDIAPTVLDYLGIAQPEWMTGQSLLSNPLLAQPIYIVQIPDSTKDKETGKVKYPEPAAPFYQFGKVTVVDCDTWYLVNLAKLSMTEGKINPYFGSCPHPTIGRNQALTLITGYLEKYGFDTSTLGSVDISK